MRPMYEIVEMIRSHYANDDDKFNNYAKTIIDYYEKYLIDIYNESYKYDYDTNSFVKKEKILHKKDTRN